MVQGHKELALIPFWIYDTILFDSYSTREKDGIVDVSIIPPENIYLNYIDEEELRILEEITIEPIGANYLFLDKGEKKELNQSISKIFHDSYHYGCIGREISFEHLNEIYKFRIVDIKVGDDNCDKWEKTNGKKLRKFYRIDPYTTVLKLPKSSKVFHLSENIDISDEFKNTK